MNLEVSIKSSGSERATNTIRNQGVPAINIDSTWQKKQSTAEVWSSSSDFSESSSEEEKDLKDIKFEERKEEEDPFQAAMKKICLKSKTVRFQNDEGESFLSS